MAPFIKWGAMPNFWIWHLEVLPSVCGLFQLKSSMWGPGSLLLSWHLRLSGCYPQFPIPHCYIPLFNFLTLSVLLFLLLSYLILPLFFPPTILFLPTPSHPLFTLIIFFPLLRRTEVSTLWSYIFESVMWSVNCILDILSY